MVRLIDADSIRYTSKGCGHPYCQQVCENIDGNGTLCKYLMTDKSEIDSLPTVDAVPVVRCVDCRIHEKCTTEDRFRFCGIEDGYCRVGIRKGVFDETD